MALKFSHGMAFGVRKKSSELLLKKRRTHIKGHKNIERESESWCKVYVTNVIGSVQSIMV